MGSQQANTFFNKLTNLTAETMNRGRARMNNIGTKVGNILLRVSKFMFRGPSI